MKLKGDDFRHLFKPLREACNITSINHVTSQRECLQDGA